MDKNTDELSKSIDALIDEIFEDSMNKGIDIAGDSSTKADDVVNKVPKSQKDESRNAGRPKQIHDVPQEDEDGESDKDYDDDISEKLSEEDVPEADQVKESSQVKKSVQVDASEYEEFKAFKKSQEEAKVEELRKAKAEETQTLIKAVVEQTSQKYEAKLEELSKALNEQQELFKAISKQPVKSKAITNIEALHKSFDENQPQVETFSKAEILDAAEELVQKGIIGMEQAIELENNGYIYDREAREALERHLKKKN